MKYYKTTGGLRWGVDAEIIEVEVERHTEKCVWIKGRRSLKRTEYENYHETWEDAWKYLMNIATYKVDSAKETLKRLNNRLDSIKALKGVR